MHTFCACVVSMHTMYVCYASHAFICLSVCLSFCLFVCLSVVCTSLFLSFYICVLCGEDVLWINEYVNKYCICRLSVFSMNLLCGCIYSVLPFFLSFCPCIVLYMHTIYVYQACMYVCYIYLYIYIYINTVYIYLSFFPYICAMYVYWVSTHCLCTFYV